VPCRLRPFRIDLNAVTLPRIVIVGAGFGGLQAARALADAPAEVLLLDRQNHHTFQPLLYQVATAGLSAPQIAAPVRHIVSRQENCSVLLAEAVAIDAPARQVHLRDALALSYDYLVVATGVTHSYFGHEADWAPHAPGLKTLDDALEIRRRVLLAFEHAETEPDPAQRAAWLTFVIVGGGPTGVELAGTLAEIAHHTLRHEFRRIDPTSARVVLVEAGPSILSSFPPALSASGRTQLEALRVEVMTDAMATAIDGHGVSLARGGGASSATQRLQARTVLWAAGVQGSPLGASLPAERDRAGRVHVTPACNLAAHPEVFVIGDLAHFAHDGESLPGVAPVANQMGLHAAACIRRLIAGEPPGALPRFAFRDKGALATIGRRAAIAVFPRGPLWPALKLSGFIAWLAWLFIHVLFLIGFRNRFTVMADWAWSYVTYQRHARLIFGAVGPREARPRRPPAG
jgi:NADH dehydrogenase